MNHVKEKKRPHLRQQVRPMLRKANNLMKTLTRLAAWSAAGVAFGAIGLVTGAGHFNGAYLLGYICLAGAILTAYKGANA